MSRLIFEAPARVKWVWLALIFLPCVPGLTFLLAGWVCDPRWPAQGMTPDAWTAYHHAAQQARGLYKAGAAVLAVGLLCGLGVVWQIVRRRDEEEEEEKNGRTEQTR